MIILNLEINDALEGHDENLLNNLENLEVLMIKFTNSKNTVANKDFAIKLMKNCSKKLQ